MEAAQGSAHIGRIRLIVLTASVVAAVYIVLEMMLSPLTSARSAGYLLPSRWVIVRAIGYLAHGVTRGDQ